MSKHSPSLSSLSYTSERMSPPSLSSPPTTMSPSSSSFSSLTSRKILEGKKLIRFCRFCLKHSEDNDSNKNNRPINIVCECANRMLSHSHLDCLQIFSRRSGQNYCEFCQNDFKFIDKNNLEEEDEDDDDDDEDDNHDKKADNIFYHYLKKFRHIFYTIINIEILQDEFYYRLSSIFDLFLVTIIMAIIIIDQSDLRRFICQTIDTTTTSTTSVTPTKTKPKEFEWQTRLVCQSQSKLSHFVGIYLIIFLLLKYYYHLNRFGQFYKRIKNFL